MNLDEALKEFDAVEANLAKLDAAWEKMQGIVPAGIAFTGSSPEGREYRELQRAFEQLLSGLPPIDGWRITALPLDLDSIAQMRFDANEVGEPGAFMTVEHEVDQPRGQIDEYRFRMTRSRRKLVRARLEELLTEGDAILAGFGAAGTTHEATASVRGPAWEGLETVVTEVDRLLGSGTRSTDWQNLRRHLSFALGCDLIDIRERDWPAVKAEVAQRAFDHSEPIPVHVPDLGVLVAAAPSGRASTAVNWAAVAKQPRSLYGKEKEDRQTATHYSEHFLEQRRSMRERTCREGGQCDEPCCARPDVRLLGRHEAGGYLVRGSHRRSVLLRLHVGTVILRLLVDHIAPEAL